MQCPNCSFNNPSGFKYCGECGTVLSKVSPESGKEEAERRQITVMFCDLVGFTGLSGQIDPEELREVVTAYKRGCAEIIYKHGGHIAQYLGDGLLVYFGYPITHEDTAQRAVRAGLEIVGGVNKLALPKAQIQQNIEVRVGIHTGVVVVGEVGGEWKHERLAVGEAPNIASKLQEIARENEVVISSDTYRLLEGEFECISMGLRNLKGIGEWVEVYRVIGEKRVRSRFGRHISKGLTPLVGREEELRTLKSLWEKVRSGEGQVVMLRGEAGIGKSRLVHEFKESIGGEGHTVVECQCLENYQNSAFYPVIELLERMMGIGREDTVEEKIGKIENYVGARCSVPRDVAVPLFASLLSIPAPEGYPPIQVTPQRQKEKTIEAMCDLFMGMTERQPVLFIMEDLHWADPSTVEFLNLFMDGVDKTRMLVFFTLRPENPNILSLSKDALISNLTLDRLNERETGEMAEMVAKEKTLPVELIRQIMAKSDGIPLYVEELTKMVMEQGVEANGGVSVHNIPSTLQDSLMARLDRLSTVKEVAQIGAAIGREFGYELIRAVYTQDEVTLRRELNRLVEAEILYSQWTGLPPQNRYSFKHALIRDAAYQSLLKSKRQQYHKKIAEVLEGRYQETIVIEPEIIAHHYTEAGLGEKAIPYWTKAGQKAVDLSAIKEAINHFRKALQLLETLPETSDRNERELTILVLMGSALALTKGYSSPEVEESYNRALELCSKLGEPPQLFPILLGLAVLYSFRDLKVTRELIDRLFRTAENSNEPSFFIWSHAYMGGVLYYQGELSSSLEQLNRAIALSGTERVYDRFGLYDPVLISLCYKAWVLWSLGYPDQSWETIHKAQSMARKLAHPLDLSLSMTFMTIIRCYRREVELLKKISEELIAHATEFGLPFYAWFGKLYRCWALAHSPEYISSVEEIETIKQMWQATGTFQMIRDETVAQIFAALFGEVYLKTGDIDAGLIFVDDQLVKSIRRGVLIFEGELNRVKGKLLLAQSEGNGVEAETCFCHAIEITRRQKAKSFELRAVMDLSRLWRRQGKRDEARKMLAEIYGWFTEGFDTKDLIEARELLNELSK